MAQLLTVKESKGLLAGFPLAETAIVTSEEECRHEADRLLRSAKRIVLKADGERLLHKVDRGLVATGIVSLGGATDAYRTVSALARGDDPSATVILQPQLAGVELIVGAKRDPTFGPLVLFGLGGTLANLYKDATIRLAPVTTEEAHAMLSEIKGKALLDGYRGGPAVDRDALAAIIVKLSELVALRPDISEVDFNPVIADERGAWIVDAKVLLGSSPASVPSPQRKRDLSPLFAPKSIAVIGASRDKQSVGYVLLENLVSKARGIPFKGKVYPVNPKAKRILGLDAYRSVSAIKGRIDLALIAVPASVVPAVLKECVAKEVGAAVIISAGFGETGPEGKRLQDELVRICAGKLPFIGPNCLGVLVPGVMNASFAPCDAPRGSVAFISQSGAIVDSVVDWASAAHYGFSAVVSAGNAADVGLHELLDHLRADPKTKAAALYIEGVADGPAFLAAAKRFTAEKPLVVLKGGKSEAGGAAISSHTGSLAGSYETYRAAFRAAGIIEAATIAELFSLARTLQSRPELPPQGTGVAVVTNAGGVGVLLADYCAAEGVPLCELAPATARALDPAMHPAWSRHNPVDLVGDAQPERYEAAITRLLAEPYVTGLIVVQTLQAVTQPLADAEILITAARRSKRPIVACWLGGKQTAKSRDLLIKAGVPCCDEPLDAVRSMKALLAITVKKRR